MTRADEPDWEPLLTALTEVRNEFMWMFEVETEDGGRLHAYKHYWTRRYLHVSQDGRTFAYTNKGVYRPVDPRPLLAEALLPLTDAEEVPRST